jgi:hypothetical protein
MPFADYKDFGDCVAQNQDKSNPEGYCAIIHKKSTGKYPSENAEQIEATTSIIHMSDEAALLQMSGPAHKSLANLFQDSVIKTIKNVHIFRSGAHIDSQGNKKRWLSSDLDNMLSSFNKGIPSSVPIKLGHTSPEHNETVAKELGIPTLVLSGEGATGSGAATLGRVSKLSRTNGTLVAEFEVPEAVADLVDKNLFLDISSEILDDYQGHGPVLSGVALLGSQRGAVKGISGLQGITILDDGTKPDYVYTFSLKKPEAAKLSSDIIGFSDKLHTFQFTSSAEEIWKRLLKLLGRTPSLRDINDQVGRTITDEEAYRVLAFIGETPLSSSVELDTWVGAAQAAFLPEFRPGNDPWKKGSGTLAIGPSSLNPNILNTEKFSEGLHKFAWGWGGAQEHLRSPREILRSLREIFGRTPTLVDLEYLLKEGALTTRESVRLLESLKKTPLSSSVPLKVDIDDAIDRRAALLSGIPFSASPLRIDRRRLRERNPNILNTEQFSEGLHEFRVNEPDSEEIYDATGVAGLSASDKFSRREVLGILKNHGIYSPDQPTAFFPGELEGDPSSSFDREIGDKPWYSLGQIMDWLGYTENTNTRSTEKFSEGLHKFQQRFKGYIPGSPARLTPWGQAHQEIGESLQQGEISKTDAATGFVLVWQDFRRSLASSDESPDRSRIINYLNDVQSDAWDKYAMGKEFSEEPRKFQQESVYEVPVEEVVTDDQGQVIKRTVHVQHHKASSKEEAKSLVFRTLERTLGSAGNIIGTGLGMITVGLMGNLTSKWFVREPRETSRSSGSTIISGIGKIVGVDLSENLYKFHQIDYKTGLRLADHHKKGVLKGLAATVGGGVIAGLLLARPPRRKFKKLKTKKTKVSRTGEGNTVIEGIKARRIGFVDFTNSLYQFHSFHPETGKKLKPHKHNLLRGLKKLGHSAIAIPGTNRDILGRPWDRHKYLSEVLHQFHTVDPKTSKPLKPHEHKTKGIIGRIKGSFAKSKERATLHKSARKIGGSEKIGDLRKLARIDKALGYKPGRGYSPDTLRTFPKSPRSKRITKGTYTEGQHNYLSVPNPWGWGQGGEIEDSSIFGPRVLHSHTYPDGEVLRHAHYGTEEHDHGAGSRSERAIYKPLQHLGDSSRFSDGLHEFHKTDKKTGAVLPKHGHKLKKTGIAVGAYLGIGQALAVGIRGMPQHRLGLKVAGKAGRGVRRLGGLLGRKRKPSRVGSSNILKETKKTWGRKIYSEDNPGQHNFIVAKVLMTIGAASISTKLWNVLLKQIVDSTAPDVIKLRTADDKVIQVWASDPAHVQEEVQNALPGWEIAQLALAAGVRAATLSENTHEFHKTDRKTGKVLPSHIHPAPDESKEERMARLLRDREAWLKSEGPKSAEDKLLEKLREMYPFSDGLHEFHSKHPVTGVRIAPHTHRKIDRGIVTPAYKS